MMILLNLLIAFGLVYLGEYIIVYGIASFIVYSSEAEILEKIRELKNKVKEFEK